MAVKEAPPKTNGAATSKEKQLAEVEEKYRLSDYQKEMFRSISAEVMLVTPDIARKWLMDDAATNRHIADGHVERLATDMKEDTWYPNADGISFNSNGRMNNGQHRLKAIIETGIPQVMVVVRGLDPRSIYTMDTGRRRTLGDQLGIMKEPHPVLLAAAVNGLWRIQHQAVRSMRNPSTVAALALLDEHPGIRDAVRACVPHNRIAPVSCTAPLWYVCGRRNVKIRDFMFERIFDGSGLERGDPIWQFRNEMEQVHRTYLRTSQIPTLAMLIKVWNALKANDPKPKIRWDNFGPDAEPFPVLA